jgi:hypothetical protein
MPVSFFMPQIVKSVMLSFVKLSKSRKDNCADPYTVVFPWKEREHPCLRSGEVNALARLYHLAINGKRFFLINV